MKTGEYFGEAALFVKTKRRATVTALETVKMKPNFQFNLLDPIAVLKKR